MSAMQLVYLYNDMYTYFKERNCRGKKLSRKVANDLNFLCVNCRGNYLSQIAG